MRVLFGRQAVWLACVLVGTSLADGAYAAARDRPAATPVLEPGEPLEVDLADTDSVTIPIPPGEGYTVIAVEEHFASLELRVPEASGVTTLRGVGEAPLLWLFDRSVIPRAEIELVVRERRALRPRATVVLRSVPDAELAALTTEAAVSRLPETAGDDALRRAARTALAAAAQWERLGAKPETARNLLVAAALFSRADDYETGRRHAEDAAARFDDLGDTVAAGLARNVIGLNSIRLDDHDRARATLERARRELAPRYDGVAVNPAESNLCFLAFRARDFDAAESCYRALIGQAAASGNQAAVDRYESTLAGVYWNRGDTLEAEAVLRGLLERPTSAGRTFERSRRLNNHAMTLRTLGRPQEALNDYQEALDIARDIDDRSQTERVINNLAVVYGDLGAPHRALEFLAELHALRKERGDRLAVLAMRNYAGALADAGRPDDALPLLERAIGLARRIGDREGLAHALRQAAQVTLAGGDAAAALDVAIEAADLAGELPEADRLLATALVTLGRVQTATGDPRTAAEHLRRSLPLWRSVDNPYGEVTARTALGWALHASGDLKAARAEALAAVARIERLRTAIASPDLRASYQSGVAAAYELAIYCEVAEGRPIAALEMVERYRAKTLLDVLSSAGGEAGASPPRALADARAATLAAINRAEDERLRGRDAPPIGPLLARLDAIDDEIANAVPAPGMRRAPEPIDAAAIRGLHAPGDMTLVYFMGRDEGFAWLVDDSGIEIATLPRAREIEDAARSLHAALARRSAFDTIAAELGRRLLAPFRERLAGAERIAILADGALHYVPFDVLTVDGQRRALLQDRPLVYPPSLTTLALSRRLPPPRGRGIAVLADPAFSADDDRVMAKRALRGGGQPLNRLRLTRLEAEAIREEAKGIDVSVHLGLDAEPAVLRSSAVAGASIVHIATHGFADDEIPARSGIALSMVDARGQPVTGFVGLRDIYGLELEADLVVLSACETALGRDLAGEGLLGLTRGFMYAGARRVVSTLWRVEDRATAELMGTFYRELFDGASPAEALAAARGALRDNRRFRHPYYWSGFTLQGDWRPGVVR